MPDDVECRTLVACAMKLAGVDPHEVLERLYRDASRFAVLLDELE
jgi:hypothetical protein